MAETPHQTPSGSSPHTRGALRDQLVLVDPGRIIPAYAGSTPTRFAVRTPQSDHPRIRGEHWAAATITDLIPGSSPHTRGALRGPGPQGTYRRIIPAYAGSTIIVSPSGGLMGDHPRIRGEHLTASQVTALGQGSSPHTRGAPDGRNTTSNPIRIIPAYAGSTPMSCRPRR